MDLFLIHIFQRQVVNQCDFLIFAAHDINAAMSSDETAKVFYGVQNLLNAGANISKMLWGQGGRKEEARKPLRESIGIANDSPLRQVTMRNHFEHMDERIDRWANESAGHNHIDLIIGSKNMFVMDTEDIDMFRWFNPETTDVFFWGDEFNLKALVDEATKILSKLREEVN